MRTGILAIAMFALAGCSSQQDETPTTKSPTVHEMMTQVVDVRADDVWAIGNAAIGDDAGIDPAMMNEEAWQKLAVAAGQLRDGAQQLSQLQPLLVTHNGVKIADEDVEFGHSADEVQSFIDREPDTFRNMALTLVSHAADLQKAAQEKDAVRAGELIGGLDPVCESCHLEFWYPSQKEILKELEQTDPTLQQEMKHVMS